MDMNVLTVEWQSFRYRPWRVFKRFWRNVRAAWHRITRGYCDYDVWNIYDWFLTVMPPMLRQLANEGSSYPADQESPQVWHDWLYKLAKNFEQCVEGAIPNKYEHVFMNHINDDDDEARAIVAKYFAREKEIAEERQDLIENTLIEMSKHFYSLWD